MKQSGQKTETQKKASYLILRIGLPMITLSLVTLLISYLIDKQTDPLLANRYYEGMLEYIIVSVLLTLGGALLASALESEREKNEKE